MGLAYLTDKCLYVCYKYDGKSLSQLQVLSTQYFFMQTTFLPYTP
jgi:hypothetical protein